MFSSCGPFFRVTFSLPRDSALSAEFLGREKLTLKNGQQELIKLELKNDAGTWQLWLDDQFKVMRMSIVGENTVVDRD